jgi:hypothetical protein
MAENKEQLINPTEISRPEETIVERQIPVEVIRDVKPEVGPIPREVKSWMEKFEISEDNNTNIVDDKTGQTILSSTTPNDTRIDLPIDRKTFADGFNKPIDNVGRWLSEFVFRFMKIKEGSVKFKEE